VDVELRNLCVLIGGNGTGKTTLLDAFWLLSESARGRLRSYIDQFHGFPALATLPQGAAQRTESSLRIGIEMGFEGAEPLRYSVELAAKGNGYGIERETLSQQRTESPKPFLHIDSRGDDIHYYDILRKGLVRPTWEHSPFETSLAQVPKHFQEPESFRQRLASSTYFHVLDVAPRAHVRLPQPMRPAELPGPNGEDLVSCLYSLRESDRDRFDAVCDTLAIAFPGFERLDFPPVGAGVLAMAWRDRRFSRPLYMYQLSEGTLRFLWLVALLHSPSLPSITLIDEPEVSLHPELLRLLAGLMREASERTQLVVATHSDRLVRFLKPEEVLVLDATEDGLSELRWADSMDLADWLTEYSLDELWQMGTLGGRAWTPCVQGSGQHAEDRSPRTGGQATSPLPSTRGSGRRGPHPLIAASTPKMIS
jgi:predicted ATPase